MARLRWSRRAGDGRGGLLGSDAAGGRGLPPRGADRPPDLFAGRGQQLADLFSIVSQPGQHAIVYGERGVGKTSLGPVAAEQLRAANVLSAWATCDASDDFSSVWRKALGEIGTTRRAISFGEHVGETTDPLSELLGPGPVTPHGVQSALQQATRQRAIATFVDEFDRFQDRNRRALFADTIKALSDPVVSSTVVLSSPPKN